MKIRTNRMAMYQDLRLRTVTASMSCLLSPAFCYLETIIGKQTTSAMATELQQQLPAHIENLPNCNFLTRLNK